MHNFSWSNWRFNPTKHCWIYYQRKLNKKSERLNFLGMSLISFTPTSFALPRISYITLRTLIAQWLDASRLSTKIQSSGNTLRVICPWDFTNAGFLIAVKASKCLSTFRTISQPITKIKTRNLSAPTRAVLQSFVKNGFFVTTRRLTRMFINSTVNTKDVTKSTTLAPTWRSIYESTLE